MRSEILARTRDCRDCLLGVVHGRTFVCETRQIVEHDPTATPYEIARTPRTMQKKEYR